MPKSSKTNGDMIKIIKQIRFILSRLSGDDIVEMLKGLLIQL